MNTGLGSGNPTIVSAFHVALFHQLLIVLGIIAAASLAWNVLRSRQLIRSARDTAGPPAVSLRLGPEPSGRRWLRIAFGALWIFDGLLQIQSSMPLGMVPGVIRPAASASPVWVQHLINPVATIWSYHPVSAAAAAVWIQIGLGAWLLAAPRGNWSRLAGAATVGWSAVVWIFGEAFGGLFAPGLTWLFGAPGAVVFYAAAGLLVALPEGAWHTPRLGRVVSGAMGAFFLAMAVLQAWPGRGFWQGQSPGSSASGTLTQMVRQMAQTPEPRLFAGWVSSFAGFDASHGWGVNLFAVLTLATIGALLLSGRPRAVAAGVAVAAVLCLADWVLVEDLGFFGGVGTDPNSMLPMLFVVWGGYLALARVPETDTRPVPVRSDEPVPVSAADEVGWRRRLVTSPTYALRSVAAVAAIAITLVGVAPMAVAATNRHADPLLAEAVDGTPDRTNSPATPFALTDQHGRSVTLRDLRGKVVALTFLDPVCTSDCPIIAQEFRAADGLLGSDARNVEMVAVDANPLYTSPAYLVAFDRQEHLDQLPNWLYLTGSHAQLAHVWAGYGALVDYLPGGAMIDHSDIAYVVDAAGHTRDIFNADPGPATEATRSSFSVTLADAIRQAQRDN